MVRRSSQRGWSAPSWLGAAVSARARYASACRRRAAPPDRRAVSRSSAKARIVASSRNRMPAPASLGVALDQALVDERHQVIEHVDAVVGGSTTCAAWSRSKPPSKTARSCRTRWSSVDEQVVAPGDRARQGPLPIRARCADPSPGSGSARRGGRGSPSAAGARRAPPPARPRAAGRRGARRPRRRPRVRTGLPARSDRARPLHEQPRTVRTQGSGPGTPARRGSAAALGWSRGSATPVKRRGDRRRRRTHRAGRSKLSSTSSTDRSARYGPRASAAGRPGPSNRPIVRAMAERTTAGSSTSASGTNHAPSAKRSRRGVRSRRRGSSCRCRPAR